MNNKWMFPWQYEITLSLASFLIGRSLGDFQHQWGEIWQTDSPDWNGFDPRSAADGNRHTLSPSYSGAKLGGGNPLMQLLKDHEAILR